MPLYDIRRAHMLRRLATLLVAALIFDCAFDAAAAR